MDNWIPTEQEYNPGIDKEQWLQLINDKTIFTDESLIFFACLKELGEASCLELSKQFGRDKQFYNSNCWQTGKRVHNKTKCPLSERENGNDRFWSVCCLGKYIDSGQVIYRIRPELLEAFEEIGVLDSVDYVETKYSWVPFYREMAEKILSFNEKRERLAELTYLLGDKANYLIYKDKKYNQLHPFAIFSIFNRGLSKENRITICHYFKDVLKVEANIPKDFDGIPIANNQKSWWGNPSDDNENDQNWNLFNAATKNETPEDFCRLFDEVRMQKGAKWFLTIGLFWINPYLYMPLDTQSREYLKSLSIDIFPETELNGKNYLELLQTIKEKMENNEIKEKSFIEISENAWKKASQRQYWAVGCPREINPDEFINNGYWYDGYANSGNKKYSKALEQIKIGDVFLLKSSSTKGKDHKLSFTKLKAIGIVVEKRTDYKFGINWIKDSNLPKDFNTITYRITIEKMRNDDMLKYAKKIIDEKEHLYNDSTNDKNTLMNENVKILLNTHNLILTGAPGTGKTYLAKEIAKAMGCSENEIGFVQFHPSYDYTDFVEGLRPAKDENGNIGFERKDGVFKEFCKRALENYLDSQKSIEVLQKEKNIKDLFDEFINDAIENENEYKTITNNKFFIKGQTEQKVIVEIPQNEKVKELGISVTEILEILNADIELNKGKEVSNYLNRKWRTQQDSYIFAIAKEIKELQKISKTKTQNIERVATKPFVFIIDEINRGEISKIFGELFFSIDPGYRGKRGLVKTQYQNIVQDGDIFKDGFFVPENVYIIGTMNDIDRSVESMDFAFRRRFAWKEIKANENIEMLMQLGTELKDEAKKRMKSLNKAISETDGLDHAYHIGASYFLKLKDLDNNFDNLWEFHLEGLLHEYLRGRHDIEDEMEKFKKAYGNVISEESTAD